MDTRDPYVFADVDAALDQGDRLDIKALSDIVDAYAFRVAYNNLIDTYGDKHPLAADVYRANLDALPEVTELQATRATALLIKHLQRFQAIPIGDARRIHPDTGRARHSWQEIADAAGISRQAAWEKYGYIDRVTAAEQDQQHKTETTHAQ